MKSRDTLIRLKRFQVEDRRRRLAQIERMISEFSRMAGDLDREIANEEKRAGIADPTHFAYPTYARAAIVRRDNLKHSAGELNGQLEATVPVDQRQSDVNIDHGLLKPKRAKVCCANSPCRWLTKAWARDFCVDSFTTAAG